MTTKKLFAGAEEQLDDCSEIASMRRVFIEDSFHSFSAKEDKSVKIGLISTQFAVNYGAVLQAYALRQTIENLGHDCEMVDYRPSNRVDGRQLVYRFDGLRSAAYSLLMLFNFSFLYCIIW